MRGLVVAVALCGLLEPAAADPDTTAGTADHSFALTWSAPPECPTAADFRAEFDKLAAVGDLSSMAVTVEVSKTEGSYALMMTARQGETSGERSLADRSCVELVRAGAVVLALAVVPTLAASPDEPAEPKTPELAEAKADRVADADRDPPDTEEVDTLLATRRDSDVPPRTSPERRLLATMRTDAAIVTGVVPGPSPGLAIAVGLGAGRIRAEAIGWLVPEQKKRMSVDGEVLGGDFQAIAIGARVCGAVVHRPVGGASLELCAGGEYLRVRGAGVGIDSPTSATDDLFAVEGATAVSFPITRRFVLRSGLSGLFYPKRSIYELTTTTPGQPPEVVTVHETASISGRLTIGLGISL